MSKAQDVLALINKFTPEDDAELRRLLASKLPNSMQEILFDARNTFSESAR